MNAATECANTGRPASGARTLSATVPAMREPLPAARRMAAVRLMSGGPRTEDGGRRISWAGFFAVLGSRSSVLRNFRQDRACGRDGIGGLEDRAADDEVVGAGCRG